MVEVSNLAGGPFLPIYIKLPRIMNIVREVVFIDMDNNFLMEGYDIVSCILTTKIFLLEG